MAGSDVWAVFGGALIGAAGATAAGVVAARRQERDRRRDRRAVGYERVLTIARHMALFASARADLQRGDPVVNLPEMYVQTEAHTRLALHGTAPTRRRWATFEECVGRFNAALQELDEATAVGNAALVERINTTTLPTLRDKEYEALRGVEAAMRADVYQDAKPAWWRRIPGAERRQPPDDAEDRTPTIA